MQQFPNPEHLNPSPMKLLTIALKDTLTRFRDFRALLDMLIAPLAIGLIMGAAFGGQKDGASPVYAIPLAVVNADTGDLGQTFVEVLTHLKVDTAEGQQPLFAVTPYANATAARTAVERGDVAGALILPPNFSAALKDPHAPRARIIVYTDPTRQVLPAIIRSTAERLALGFQSAALGARLAAEQITAAAQADPSLQTVLVRLPQAITEAEAEFAAEQQAALRLHLQSQTVGVSPSSDMLDYFMPSMAIFFLMFAVFGGMRSILEEEKQGTLPRLLTTPTSTAEILAGKIGGTLLTGLLQMAVLVLVSALFFGVHWGNPWGVALLSVATVIGAAGLGALLAAFARDDNQAGIVGTFVALVFGMLGGNFIMLRNIPPWLDVLSKATLNRWALDGFTALALKGAPPRAVLPNAAILLAMGTAFFALALLGFRRRFIR